MPSFQYETTASPQFQEHNFAPHFSNQHNQSPSIYHNFSEPNTDHQIPAPTSYHPHPLTPSTRNSHHYLPNTNHLPQDYPHHQQQHQSKTTQNTIPPFQHQQPPPPQSQQQKQQQQQLQQQLPPQHHRHSTEDLVHDDNETFLLSDLDENVDHYLNSFRVNQCEAFLQHKCNKHKPFTCFDWHFKNQRRRKPMLTETNEFNYSPDVYCTVYSETSGECQNGDDCPYLHRNTGDTERRYHLRYYKTQICNIETDEKTGHCIKNGSHCAYAHGSRQLRRPVYSSSGDVNVTPKLHAEYANSLLVSSDTSGDSTPPNGQPQLQRPPPLLPESDIFAQFTSDQELRNVSVNPVQSSPLNTSAMTEHQKTQFDQQREICREKIIPDDPRWADANFVQIHYKTEKCTKPPRLCRQGYACPYYHNPRDRRRSPKIFDYTSTACPNVKMGMDWKDPSNCNDGDKCAFCHTRTEQQFHHDIYKSNKCNDMQQSGYCPRGNFCAFAHVINTSRNSTSSLARGNSADTNISTPPSADMITKRMHPHAEAMRNRIRSDSNLLRNFGTREHMLRKLKSPSISITNDLAEQMSTLDMNADDEGIARVNQRMVIGDKEDGSPPGLGYRSASVGQATMKMKTSIRSLRRKMPSCSEMMTTVAKTPELVGNSNAGGTQPRLILGQTIHERPVLSDIKTTSLNTSSCDFELAPGRSPQTGSIFEAADKGPINDSPVAEPADFGFSASFKGPDAKEPKENWPGYYSSSVQASLPHSAHQSQGDLHSNLGRDPELEKIHAELKTKYACLQQQFDNEKNSGFIPKPADLRELPKLALIELRQQLQNGISEIDKVLLGAINIQQYDNNNNKSPQSVHTSD